MLRQHPYALLIVDSTSAGPPLPTVLEQVRSVRSQQPVLVLSGPRVGADVRLPLQRFGRSALLPRHACPAEVVRTIGTLLDTTVSYSAQVPAAASSVYQSGPPTPFSRREMEVLRLVVGDCCNREIADQLCLSVRTVESHRRALLQKAGAKTLVGLVVWAVRGGWVMA
jgi:DNA-binding NarL/FixJ family response regulator